MGTKDEDEERRTKRDGKEGKDGERDYRGEAKPTRVFPTSKMVSEVIDEVMKR
jgi:hypothetical protein